MEEELTPVDVGKFVVAKVGFRVGCNVLGCNVVGCNVIGCNVVGLKLGIELGVNVVGFCDGLTVNPAMLGF